MSPIIDSVFVPGPGESLPGFTSVAGSGLAVPGGLECVFEYRNLLLNVQGVPDRYRVEGIDGLSDPDIRDTRDSNTNSDGETPYNSFYGGRTITITGSIMTYSIPKLRDMVTALKGAFADISNEYPLFFRTGNAQTDHLIYCKKISALEINEQQTTQDVIRQFQVTLRASDPRFLGNIPKFLDVTTEGSYLAAPLLLGNATNIGNYKASPTFRVYGPSTTSTIYNDATDQWFSLGPIGNNDYLEYNMRTPPSRSYTLKDSKGIDQWERLVLGSQYIDLLGNSNDLSNWTGDNNLWYVGDASRIWVGWQDSWV